MSTAGSGTPGLASTEPASTEPASTEPASTERATLISDDEAARRWRLVLGRYAADQLSVGQQDAGLERSLRYLYDREYTSRGHRVGQGGDGSGQPGRGAGLGGSQPHGVDVTALGWLNEAGSLFPRETFERMQVDAVSRYGLTELLQDDTALETLEP